MCVKTLTDRQRKKEKKEIEKSKRRAREEVKKQKEEVPKTFKVKQIKDQLEQTKGGETEKTKGRRTFRWNDAGLSKYS